MERTASFYPELTESIKEILNDISILVLKEHRPIWIVDEYKWFVCSLGLLAKQINLCESCVLLLENGMEQEAYLMARSQYNNMLWIKYICEDKNGKSADEYLYQPNVGQIKQANKMYKMIQKFTEEIDDKFKEEAFLKRLNDIQDENKKILEEAGMKKLKYKTVIELAQQDLDLMEMYLTIYNTGSKIEHSDNSVICKYRKEILEGYNNVQLFSMELSKSDRTTWIEVVNHTIMILFYAYETFYNRICTSERHLLESIGVLKPTFEENALKKIIEKFRMCQKMLEKTRK